MKESIKKTLKSRTNIILIVFIIFLVDSNLENTVLGYTNNTFSIISKIVRYACYAIFLFNIYCDWKNGENITWPMIISGIISVVVCIFSENRYLILLLIVLFGVRKINIKKLIEKAYYTNLITLIIVVLLSIVGIIPDWTFYRDNMQIRHSLGYHYPTTVSTYFFFILLMRFYMKKEKISVFELFIEIAVTIILFLLTDSKTAIILSMLVILIIFTIKILNKYKPIIKKILNKKIIKYAIYAIPILIILLLIFIVFYNENQLICKINEIFSDRIYYARQAIRNYRITPFGKQIKWYGWGGFGYIEQKDFLYNYVDISYIKMLLDCGVTTLMLFIISYIFTLREMLKKNDYYSVYILLIVLLWGILEPNILNISINIFIVFMISTINLKPISKFKHSSVKKLKKKGEKYEKNFKYISSSI